MYFVARAQLIMAGLVLLIVLGLVLWVWISERFRNGVASLWAGKEEEAGATVPMANSVVGEDEAEGAPQTSVWPPPGAAAAAVSAAAAAPKARTASGGAGR